MRSASPVVFLALLFTNGEAFSVVKPSVSSGLYQRPTFAKATQLFAGQDSFPAAVLEKESTTTQISTDAVKENPTAGTDVAPTETAEELSETQKLMQQVKDAGTAGVISYALWELGFWAISVPVVLFGYFSVTGHLPDLSNKEDTAKLPFYQLGESEHGYYINEPSNKLGRGFIIQATMDRLEEHQRIARSVDDVANF